MPFSESAYRDVVQSLPPGVRLVAVSKTKPADDIRELYALGQRAFGENYVQELLEKKPLLPADVEWHFLGHLQSNKVKPLIAQVHLIHSVDSVRLLKEIHKQATKAHKVVDCLLQVHIAREETKFGFAPEELREVFRGYPGGFGGPDAKGSARVGGDVFTGVRVRGLMGMASNVSEEAAVRAEFRGLKELFDGYRDRVPDFDILSMGMSGDYHVAVEEGSTLVRIGSLIFGAR